jgi:hypothetical protein
MTKDFRRASCHGAEQAESAGCGSLNARFLQELNLG